MKKINLNEVYKKGKFLLEKKRLLSEYTTDLRVIFEHIFGVNRLDLVIEGKNLQAKEEKIKVFFEFLKRKMSGEPLHYILGEKDFFGMNLSVRKGVFIPREETEFLVKFCVTKANNAKRIIDLCSGSGAVSLALKKELNFAKIYAVEISSKAFVFLQKNIEKTKLEINAINEDIFEIYKDFPNDFFDIVVSNPPYIRNAEIPFLQKEVRFEPEIALAGGKDGLDFYRGIAEKWRMKLRKNGLLAFEAGFKQTDKIKKIMLRNGFKNIETWLDFNGIERVIGGFCE